MVLHEGVSTFDNWVSPRRTDAAKNAYRDIAFTQEGQLKILADAAEGKHEAADLLFDLYKKIISKAFWKYYLGPDKKYHAPRIRAGADKDFASMAYEMLLGAGETSPYATFKPSKFTDKADLLKQFGYYLYRYLQNEAVKAIRLDKMGGVAGNVDTTAGVVSTVGYEDHFENSEEAASVDASTAETDIKETIRAFLPFLKKIRPLYHDIFVSRLENNDIEATAEKLGISGQSVRNHLRAIKEIYDDFTGEGN